MTTLGFVTIESEQLEHHEAICWLTANRWGGGVLEGDGGPFTLPMGACRSLRESTKEKGIPVGVLIGPARFGRCSHSAQLIQVAKDRRVLHVLRDITALARRDPRRLEPNETHLIGRGHILLETQ